MAKIANFAFRAQLASWLRTAVTDWAAGKTLAEAIFAVYLKVPFHAALEKYLQVCETIDRIKTEVKGHNASTDRSNALMSMVGIVFVRETSLDEAQIEAMRRMREVLKDGQGASSWFFPKMESLHHFAEHKQMNETFVRSSPKLEGAMLETFRDNLPDPGRMTTDIIHEVSTLRKYGVKSAFFQDGIMHHPGNAWVFMDFRDTAKGVADASQIPVVPLAVASLTLGVPKGVLGTEYVIEQKGQGAFHTATLLFQASAVISLEPSGELDCSHGYGLLPLRKIFRDNDREELYDLFRLAHAIRLYDLVVPLETVSRMPQARRSGFLGRIKDFISRPMFKDLVLPRLRALDGMNELVRQVEREVEEAEAETRRRRREMERHDVIYHVRRLPLGRSPSPAAKARAQEYGIPLSGNETFIRSHERGSGPRDSRPHRAVVRK